MIELSRVLDRIRGGREFAEEMRILEMEKTLSAWQLGLLQLETVWEIARSASGSEREGLAERLTALFYLYPLADQIWNNPTVEGAVTETLARQPHEIYADFANMVMNCSDTFEEGLADVCKDSLDLLKLLALGLIDVDLDKSSACLMPHAKEGWVELSMRHKGLSPQELLKEVASDLEEIRCGGDEELRQRSIIGYSWLFDGKKKKTERLLNSLEIGPANGGELTYFDPNEWLDGGGLPVDEGEGREVMMASVTAIPLSSVNLARFLLHSRLPRVGRLIMSAKDFWK